MTVIFKIIICVLLLILAVLLEVLIIGKMLSTFKSQQTRRIKKEKNKMREDLGIFKGKRKDGRDWVTGYLSRRTICTPDGAHLGYVIQKPNITLHNDEWYEVVKDSIREFTGKADKNGKCIFEGDICRFYEEDGYEGSLYEIFWGNYGWRVREICSGRMGSLNLFFAVQSEIVGNVFDNPELLQKEN